MDAEKQMSALERRGFMKSTLLEENDLGCGGQIQDGPKGRVGRKGFGGNL